MMQRATAVVTIASRGLPISAMTAQLSLPPTDHSGDPADDHDPVEPDLWSLEVSAAAGDGVGDEPPSEVALRGVLSIMYERRVRLAAMRDQLHIELFLTAWIDDPADVVWFGSTTTRMLGELGADVHISIRRAA